LETPFKNPVSFIDLKKIAAARKALRLHRHNDPIAGRNRLKKRVSDDSWGLTTIKGVSGTPENGVYERYNRHH
jgi:hypothetical protein